MLLLVHEHCYETNMKNYIKKCQYFFNYFENLQKILNKKKVIHSYSSLNIVSSVLNLPQYL